MMENPVVKLRSSPDCPEAAKAIAAGREAIEAVKSIKTVYDLTESELREGQPVFRGEPSD